MAGGEVDGTFMCEFPVDLDGQNCASITLVQSGDFSLKPGDRDKSTRTPKEGSHIDLT